MVKVSLAEKLLVRLQKLGLNKRKATDLAKKLAPSAARQPVRGTVTGKLTDKLYALGLSKKRAEELAKGLAPTVRSAIKAKAKAKKVKLDDVDDAFVNEIVDEGVDLTESEELDKVAPRVNGHRVRLDLPVVARSFWQRSPVQGIELLRVMDGLTTYGTYLSAAVKGDVGIVAVRQLGENLYNVKFYPRMSYWGYTPERCEKLGAVEYLEREWYQRMHFSREGTDKLLKQIHAEQKPKLTRLAARLLGVTGKVLFKAFDFLHKRQHVAA